MMQPQSETLRRYLGGAYRGNSVGFLSDLRAERAALEAAPGLAERFLGTYKDGPAWNVPRRLSCLPAFHSSTMMLDLHQRADWRGVDLRLMAAVACIIETARGVNVPLYVSHVLPDRAFLLHAKFPNMLTETETRFLHKMAEHAQRKLKVKALPYPSTLTFRLNAGHHIPADIDRPENNATGHPEPVRKTPRALWRDTKGFRL